MENGILDLEDKITELRRKLGKDGKLKELEELTKRLCNLYDEVDTKYPLFLTFKSTGEVIPMDAFRDNGDGYFKDYLPLRNKLYAEYMQKEHEKILQDYTPFLKEQIGQKN